MADRKMIYLDDAIDELAEHIMESALMDNPTTASTDIDRYRPIAELSLRDVPSAQPEQRYTEEELRVFQHGISLSLLSKRSAQHWRYDEDTATEIEFLERLYDKVSADMREGGEDADR